MPTTESIVKGLGYFYPGYGERRAKKEERQMFGPLNVKRFGSPRWFKCGHRAVIGRRDLACCFECAIVELKQNAPGPCAPGARTTHGGTCQQ